MVAAVSNTAYGIINDAMQDAGYLQEGQLANSEQLATYMRRLCDIINLWQTQGLKLFLLQDFDINLVASQSQYPLSPISDDVITDKPLRVLQAYVLDASSSVKRPLIGISWNEWINLSQTTGNTGAINSYFIDKQATQLNVNVWMTPDTAEALNSLHLLLQIQAANPIMLTDDVSFPQEWRIALRWGLADDICTGQPQAIMDRCAQKAEFYRTILEDWDVEDTGTRFTPDMRNNQDVGGFQ
mgnify:CR=1 FL=1|tara:strand:+ start:368 stop:1090 length:723 start_codon:yes stop_codon:yes gene_type:complete